MRMRLIVKPTEDRRNDLEVLTELRRILWTQAPIWVDPEHPLEGGHRDLQGRWYMEFATDDLAAVRRILDERGYAERVELQEAHEPLGGECVVCNNVAGPFLPTVCPNCGFRDISPCPVCGQEIPREHYKHLGGDLFRCPHCRNRVRFRYNSPMFQLDGSFNPPLIMVDEVEASHEVR